VMIDIISLFEICPWCSQKGRKQCPVLKPMVLCGFGKEMQCDVCNRSWKLPQSEELLELARRQRENRYDK
jgi:hypothetical protein